MLELQDKVGAWRLTPAVAAFGRLIQGGPERFSVTLTSNFDPLLEVSLTKVGRSYVATDLDSDARLGVTYAPGAHHVAHFHGSWVGSRTLHTPSQIGRPRPLLVSSMDAALRGRTVVVLGYGGWDDVFTQWLCSRAQTGFDGCDILWAFYEGDEMVLRQRYARILSLLESGIDGHVHLYSGIDANELLPAIAARPFVRQSFPAHAHPLPMDAMRSASAASILSPSPNRADVVSGWPARAPGVEDVHRRHRSVMDLELTSKMRNDLHAALLNAFPAEKLEQFVSQEFEFMRMTNIGDDAGQLRISRLIAQAEAMGEVRHLVRRACWNNRDAQRLRAFCEEYLPSVFPLSLLKVLADILTQPEFNMELLYRAAFAIGASGIPKGGARSTRRRFIEDLIDQLADLPVRLLRFTERLAIEVGPTRALELRRWSDEAAAIIDMETQLAELRRKLDAEAPAEPLFLLVKVDLDGHEHFLLKIWRMEETGNGEVLIGGDGERHRLASLDQVLEAALAAACLKLGPTLERVQNRFTVEFALPRALLCHPVERIRLDAGVGSLLPLALLQIVILRASERLKLPVSGPIRARWRAKWKALLRGEPREQGVMFFPALDEFDRETARARLARHAYCVAFGMAAPRALRSPAPDPLRYGIIEPGVPIGIWVREPASGVMTAEASLNATRAVSALLAADVGLSPNPRDESDHLLAKLSQMRADAADESSGLFQHAGHHVAVLWDDPDRVPAEFLGEADLESP